MNHLFLKQVHDLDSFLFQIHKKKFVGGHAVCCVGYDDMKQHFIVLNSWGTEWGDRGYCYIPYQFIVNNDLCNDCHAFLDVELKLLGTDETADTLCLDCLSPKNGLKSCTTI